MPVAYILRSFPRLSQTFILNEILSLERLGVQLRLFAMTNPHEEIVQPEVAQVQAPVVYLDEVVTAAQAWDMVEEPPVLLDAERYVNTRRYVEDHEELDVGYTTASRCTCFAMAVYIAQSIEHDRQRDSAPISHIHAHFAHDPTLIAQLVHMLTGVSYSFTAHARDLYQILPDSLVSRVEMATSVATCSAMNMDYFRQELPPSLLAKVKLIYHGVDTERFTTIDQAAPNPVPQIISIGRLVEKKGFGDLLAACGKLKAASQPFRCAIYGEGPLYNDLMAQIDRLGLENEVSLPGACTQQELVPVLQRADIFALTPFVTEDGDRDGVPNVLVEAMGCGLPVVSTAVAGIPELVRDGENGLLAPAHDIDGITAALRTLLTNEALRKSLGVAARSTVAEHFDLQDGARQMQSLFSTVSFSHSE